MCCCQLYEELALEEHKMNLYGGLEMARQLQQQASGGGGGGQDNLVFERTEEEGAQERHTTTMLDVILTKFCSKTRF